MATYCSTCDFAGSVATPRNMTTQKQNSRRHVAENYTIPSDSTEEAQYHILQVTT